VAFDRSGHDNAPQDFAPDQFGAYDIGVIGALDAPGLLPLEYRPSIHDLAYADFPVAARVVADAMVFIVPLDRADEPQVLYLTYEKGFTCRNANGGVMCRDPHFNETIADSSPVNDSIPLDDSLGPQPN
jgi:hypothetical protein